MSTSGPIVTRGRDAPPIVRILAASLRRAAARPDVAKQLSRLRGRVALRSTVGPQAATIEFSGDAVHVTHGVARDADLVIAGDIDTMGRPGAPKPKVTGVVRHPRLALGVGKVLDAPPLGGWRAAVDEFWSWAHDEPGRPQQLLTVCTDVGEGDHLVGQPGGSCVEVHGPAWALLAVFTGGDHLGAAVLEGRLQAVADFPTLSRFVGVMTRYMLDEGRSA
jgi:hypothetical protein